MAAGREKRKEKERWREVLCLVREWRVGRWRSRGGECRGRKGGEKEIGGRKKGRRNEEEGMEV